MARLLCIQLLILLICLPALAQNPICPPGVYLADPAAHVWPDGNLYVYGSVDINSQHYCSWTYNFFSTSDMKTWTLHKDRFASRGPNDQVPETDARLWAPDCQMHNNLYYLYYCLPDRQFTQGVATSPDPMGPFRNGKNIELYGRYGIDPCVFIDDDGQVYYLWGLFNAKIAKLQPDFMGIDSTTIVDNVLTQEDHFFHEAAHMVKRNGIYYIIYADISRAQRPTCLGYSVSKSPTGPYTYGGVIIDNDHCDPQVWNNHGSLVQYHDQWYVFYHRSTHGSSMMRKACVEPITFNADGSISEVEMTSKGAGLPLDAFSTIEAERACLLHGNVRILAFCADNEELSGLHRNDRAAFKTIDFGSGADYVTVRVRPGGRSGKIELALDFPWSPAFGTVEIPGVGNDPTWQDVTAEIDTVSGVHEVWLRFLVDDSNACAVDCFYFAKRP